MSESTADSLEEVSATRQLAIRGAAFEIGGFGLGQVVRLGSNLILTRLLFPEAFGLAALVAIVMQGLEMFSDVGLQQAIIQSPRGDEPRFLDTAWTIQVLRGIGMWLIAALIAWPMALFYGEPELRDLLIVGCLPALVLGFQSTALFTLRRRIQLGWITGLELIGQLVNVAVMLAWASVHPTVWALVVGGIAASIVRCVGTHLLPVPHRNRFAWEPESVDAILHFGKWIFGSSIVFFLGSRGDRLLLGRLVGVGTLGVYSIAVMLSELVINVIERINGGVFYPLFSRSAREGTEALRASYRQARLWIDLLAMPGIGVLMAIAEPLVHFLWDERYADAGWMLEILCLRVAMSAIYACSETSLTATGRPQYGFGRSVVRTAWVLVGTLVGYRLYGLEGIVWTVALSELPSLLVIVPGLHRIGLLSVWRELRFLLPVGLAYGATVAVLGALGL